MYLSCRTLEWDPPNHRNIFGFIPYKTMDKDGVSLSLYKQPLPMAFNSIYFSPFFLAQIPDTEERKGSFIFPWQSFKLLSLWMPLGRVASIVSCRIKHAADRIPQWTFSLFDDQVFRECQQWVDRVFGINIAHAIAARSAWYVGLGDSRL